MTSKWVLTSAVAALSLIAALSHAATSVGGTDLTQKGNLS
jgi:hypothetical protein